MVLKMTATKGAGVATSMSCWKALETLRVSGLPFRCGTDLEAWRTASLHRSETERRALLNASNAVISVGAVGCIEGSFSPRNLQRQPPKL